MGAQQAPGPVTRKPYRITKQRERWSEQEHEKFLRALQKYGRRWKDIVDYVGTRSVAQVRSHAQKYFLKLEKCGEASGVPPARPKRRAAKPYPVKQTAEAHRKAEKPPAAPKLKARTSARAAERRKSATPPPQEESEAEPEAEEPQDQPPQHSDLEPACSMPDRLLLDDADLLLSELDPLRDASSPASQLLPSNRQSLANSLLPSDSMLQLSDALRADDLMAGSDTLDSSGLLPGSEAAHPSGDKESNGSNAEASCGVSGGISGVQPDHLTSSMSSADFQYASCLVGTDCQQPTTSSAQHQHQALGCGDMDEASPAPDAGKLYAIVGSMFENGCTMDQQVSMMEQLPPNQRETLLQMMNQLTYNLKEAMTTQQMELDQFQDPIASHSHQMPIHPADSLCPNLDPWKLGSADPLWQAVEAAQLPPTTDFTSIPSSSGPMFPF